MQSKTPKLKKIYVPFLLCFMSIMLSCQTDIGRVLGRPETPSSCLAWSDGTCLRNGIELEVKNMECIESNHRTNLEEYLLKIELDLYLCRKNPKKCHKL